MASARRVLPMPGGPSSVRSRPPWPSSRLHSRRTSALRPSKGVGGEGSGARRIRLDDRAVGTRQGERRRAFAARPRRLLDQLGGGVGVVLQAERGDKPLHHGLEVGPALPFIEAGDERIAVAQRRAEVALGHAGLFAQLFGERAKTQPSGE